MRLRPLILTATLLLVAAASAYASFNVERKTPVAVGEEAPDFTLQDQSGQQVKLSESRDKSPVVLVFYRGYW